jgi:hypothetical protein
MLTRLTWPDQPLRLHSPSYAIIRRWVWSVWFIWFVWSTPQAKKLASPVSHPLYPPIASRFTFHVLRFTSPEMQVIYLGENGILYREHVRHNRRAILQDA